MPTTWITEPVTIDGISGLRLTGYQGDFPSGIVDIDAQFQLPILEIGPNAFIDTDYYETLTGLKFRHVIRIGASAFESNEYLVSADFPKCKLVESSAFFGCSRLQTCIFPELVELQIGAFQAAMVRAQRTGNITLSFPKLTTIGIDAFYTSALDTFIGTLVFPSLTTVGNTAFQGRSVSVLYIGGVSAYSTTLSSGLGSLSTGSKVYYKTGSTGWPATIGTRAIQTIEGNPFPAPPADPASDPSAATTFVNSVAKDSAALSAYVVTAVSLGTSAESVVSNVMGSLYTAAASTTIAERVTAATNLVNTIVSNATTVTEAASVASSVLSSVLAATNQTATSSSERTSTTAAVLNSVFSAPSVSTGTSVASVAASVMAAVYAPTSTTTAAERAAIASSLVSSIVSAANKVAVSSPTDTTVKVSASTVTLSLGTGSSARDSFVNSMRTVSPNLETTKDFRILAPKTDTITVTDSDLQGAYVKFAFVSGTPYTLVYNGESLPVMYKDTDDVAGPYLLINNNADIEVNRKRLPFSLPFASKSIPLVGFGSINTASPTTVTVNPTPSGADPYVTTLGGKTYKLPVFEAPIRYYQGMHEGKLLTVNVSLKAISAADMQADMLTQAITAKGRIPKSHWKRAAASWSSIGDATYFEKVYVKWGEASEAVFNIFDHKIRVESIRGPDFRTMENHGTGPISSTTTPLPMFANLPAFTAALPIGSNGKLFLSVFAAKNVRNAIRLQAEDMQAGNGVIIHRLSREAMTLPTLESLQEVLRHDFEAQRDIMETFYNNGHKASLRMSLA